MQKFTKEQMNEIQKGIFENIDVSIYANPKFSAEQMYAIRKGLEKRLDVGIYADPKFNAEQMAQIREGLENKVDVSMYADEKFDWKQMWQIGWGLKDGLNVSVYTNPKFDYMQMEEIRRGIKINVDVLIYANIHFNWEQMREIRQGLEHDVDVSIYADPKFNAEQMAQIRQGLENALDVSIYANNLFTAWQMKQIKDNLKSNKADELQNSATNEYETKEFDKKENLDVLLTKPFMLDKDENVFEDNNIKNEQSDQNIHCTDKQEEIMQLDDYKEDEEIKFIYENDEFDTTYVNDIEVDKIYAYSIGENELIAKDKLTLKGIANVYNEAKKLWFSKDLDSSINKYVIFGVDKDGRFYKRRPDKVNFEDNSKKFSKETLKSAHNLKEMLDESFDFKMFRLQDMDIIDSSYNTNIKQTFAKLNNVDVEFLADINIQDYEYEDTLEENIVNIEI